MIEVSFSTDMRRIRFWATRMGVNLHEPKQLTEPYIWSQSHLHHLADLLVDFHGFRPADATDKRMLFALMCDPYAWRVGAVPSSTPPRGRIELPMHASSFFSPNRQRQWENIFHSPLWDSIGHINVPGSNTVRDLLNFLQCLLPGVFIIVESLDGCATQRGIPPSKWVLESKEILVSCLGTERYEALSEAASNSKRAIVDSPLEDASASEMDS